MAKILTCPDDPMLERLVLGPTTIEEREAFAQHLEHCSHCAARLEKQLNASPLVHGKGFTTQMPVPVDQGMMAMMDYWQQRAAEISGNTSSQATPPGNTEEPTFSNPPRNVAREFGSYLAPPQTQTEFGRLGNYRLLRVLGEGGMGVVFLAEDTILKRQVALKLMRPSLIDSGTHRERFLREARSAATLKHDHIVTIYSAGEEKGVAFIAMELLQGETLEARLKQAGPLPVAEVLRLGRQMAEGLAAAHERGLVHRDIKPGNIWLETAADGGEADRVKILDFGLVQPAEGKGELTSEGMILGTPAYMAPEQAEGGQCDQRSDLFSLGCVLYRMCAGKMPFQGATPLQQMKSVFFDQPKPPSQTRAEVPKELSCLVMRLLSKEREKRPATARYVVTQLTAVGKEVPAEETVAMQALPRRPSPRGHWAAIAAGLLLLVGGLFAAQIFIRIRDKDGKVVAELPLQPGQKVEVEKEGKVIATVKGEEDKLPPVPTGEPLSPIALVSRPAKIEGVKSWTIEPVGHRGEVTGLSYSPNGRWLASFGQDGVLRLWEAESGKLYRAFVQQHHGHGPLAWSRDSRRIAVAHSNTDDKTPPWQVYVSIWDITSGRVLQKLEHPYAINRLAWSTDDKQLVTGCRDAKCRLWDVSAGEHVKTIENARFFDYALNKEILAIVNWKRLWLWDAVKDREIHSVQLEPQFGDFAQTPLQWSPDGKFLALWDSDAKKVTVWNSTTLKLLSSTPEPEGYGHIAWSPDSMLVACANQVFGSGEAYVVIVDATTRKRLRRCPTSPSRGATAICWSPDGKTIALGTSEGSIHIFDANKGDLVRSFPGYRNDFLTFWQSAWLYWSAHGNQLMLGGWATLDVASGKFVRPTQNFLPSPDGKVKGCYANHLDNVGGKIFNESSDKVIQFLPHPGGGPGCFAWSADSRIAITGNYSPKDNVKVWEAATGKLLHTFTLPGIGVSALALSPDGKTLVVGSAVVSLVDLNTGKAIRTLDRSSFYANYSLAWSLDGASLAVGAANGKVEVWNASGEKLLRSISAHSDSVAALIWSPNGKLLASSSYDGVRLWDAATGRPHAVVVPFLDEKGLVISAAGHYRSTPIRNRNFVYVVDRGKGQETFLPDEFEETFKWKNDPEQVRISDK